VSNVENLGCGVIAFLKREGGHGFEARAEEPFAIQRLIDKQPRPLDVQSIPSMKARSTDSSAQTQRLMSSVWRSVDQSNRVRRLA
jgi:hypothetical protein